MKKPNEALKREKELRGWTQADLAKKLGTTKLNVGRWERGESFPSPFYREKLCKLFKKNAEELGFLQNDGKENKVSVTQHSSSSQEQITEEANEYIEELVQEVKRPPQTIWFVPYKRNLYFTGREEILTQLQVSFFERKTSLPAYALSGLPGVGKTQIAVEYAYRHYEKYQAILWASADTKETLTADFIDFAHVLNLPEKDDHNQKNVIHAVQRWMSFNSDWLLIFDNVEDLNLASSFFPPFENKGHILLTTRAQISGVIATKIDVETLETKDGASFLLHRANIIQTDDMLTVVVEDNKEKAALISNSMGGLLLALDQAGAYIDELSCTLTEYLELYHMYRAKLLQRRGNIFSGHPESIVTTVLMMIEKIEQRYPDAAELLCLYAFLHPDSIPKNFLAKNTVGLSSRLQVLASDPSVLNEAIGELVRYSLVLPTDKPGIFRMHRLVQDVLKDAMKEERKREWAEQTVKIVNQALPSTQENDWHSSSRHFIAHAEVCASLIQEQKMVSEEAAQILTWVGMYLHENSQFNEAALFIKQAADIQLEISSDIGINTLEAINHLGVLAMDSGNYVHAENLFKQVIVLSQQDALTPLNYATMINNLGELRRIQGQYEEAKQNFQEALKIRELILDAENPLIATSINCIAEVYIDQEQYAEADVLLNRALKICENVYGENHVSVAENLHDLAFLRFHQGMLEEAELYFLKAVQIFKQELGPTTANYARSLNGLAETYIVQKRFKEAEELFLEVLSVREQVLGASHPDIAQTLRGLAWLYSLQDRLSEAELYFLKALAIRGATLGIHPATAASYHDLGEFYCEQGNYNKAKQHYKLAIQMYAKIFGPEHPKTILAFEEYEQIEHL